MLTGPIIVVIALALLVFILRGFIILREAKRWKPPVYKYRVRVNLEHVEVKAAHQRWEKTQPGLALHHDMEVFDERLYDQDPYSNQRELVYLVCEHEGRKYMSQPVQRSEMGVRVDLLKQQFTWLHYNGAPESGYWFDVSFLGDEMSEHVPSLYKK